MSRSEDRSHSWEDRSSRSVLDKWLPRSTSEDCYHSSSCSGTPLYRRKCSNLESISSYSQCLRERHSRFRSVTALKRRGSEYCSHMPYIDTNSDWRRGHLQCHYRSHQSRAQHWSSLTMNSSSTSCPLNEHKKMNQYAASGLLDHRHIPWTYREAARSVMGLSGPSGSSKLHPDPEDCSCHYQMITIWR